MRLPIAIVMALGATAGAEPKLAGNVLVWVDASMYLDRVATDDEAITEAPHPNDASIPDRTLHLCAPAAAVVVELRSHY